MARGIAVNIFCIRLTCLKLYCNISSNIDSSPGTQILSGLILTHVGWVLGICPFLMHVSNFTLVGTNR